MAGDSSPWKTLGILAGTVGAVLAVVFVVVPQLNPKTAHSGELIDVQLIQYGPGPNASYLAKAHLVGFNGKNCPLGYTIRRSDTGQPVQPAFAYSGFFDSQFHAESDDDQATMQVQVSTPPLPGNYYVAFYLYDNDGKTILDSANGATFKVGG